MASQGETRVSPFMPIFEGFRDDLDQHHDRRERIIKVSRDVTAASKKIIFALQRIRLLGQPIPAHIEKITKPHYETIHTAFNSVAADLQGINAYRYSRNITGGIQEYMEAVTFQHYLEKQELLSLGQAHEDLRDICPENPLFLTGEDYLLGVYDMTGELMRFAITTMATSGNLLQQAVPSDDVEMANTATGAKRPRSVLDDLREVCFRLTTLDSGSDFHFARDVSKKLSVTQQSVEKVEKAAYGLIVRGSERPKGWMPDLSEGGNPAEVESY